MTWPLAKWWHSLNPPWQLWWVVHFFCWLFGFAIFGIDAYMPLLDAKTELKEAILEKQRTEFEYRSYVDELTR